MPTFVNIPNYLQIAEVSQYLSGREQAMNEVFRGKSINNNYTRLLRLVRSVVQWAYNRNPSDLTTQPSAVFMFQLCEKYAVQAQNIINNLTLSPPVITGPVNQSVTVGNTATFSVSVTGTAPFTYAWYLNGVLIPGATGSSYSKTNAQLSDSGGLYSVKVSNAASPGGVFSNTATLTVVAALQGFYYYGDTDYTADLQGGNDDVPYLGTFPITNGNPLSVTLPIGAANNKWEIFKYPISQGIKTTWFNTALNQGALPDGVFQSVLTIGSFYYIYSRVQISIDTSQPMVFS